MVSRSSFDQSRPRSRRLKVMRRMQERTFEPDGSMPDLIVYFCRSRSELVYLFVYQRLCLFRLRIALTSVGAFDCLVDGETGRARVEVRLKRSNGIAFERRIRQPAIPWHRSQYRAHLQHLEVKLMKR